MGRIITGNFIKTDMETQIEKLAKEILLAREKARLERIQRINKERREREAKVLKLFMEEFKDYLPMLQEAGIAVTSDHKTDSGTEVYIRFKKGRRILRMDYSLSGTYRYEYTNPGYGARGVYDKWDKEDFIMFIYEGLLAPEEERP